MPEVPIGFYSQNSEKRTSEQNVDFRRFGEALRSERKAAEKLVKKYFKNEDLILRDKKKKEELKKLAEEFKKWHQKRRKYQKRVWVTNFVEDERIGFGGGEVVLRLSIDGLKSPVVKYLLTVAQALEITDRILSE